MAGGGMAGKKKQAMKRGGKVVSRAMGGPMKAKKKMAGGGMMNVSPRKAMAMGMKNGGKVMKGKKKKVKKAKKRG